MKLEIGITDKHLLKEFLNDHETVIVELRKDIDECNEKNKDAGTTDLMAQHESTAWILRRYLN